MNTITTRFNAFRKNLSNKLKPAQTRTSRFVTARPFTALFSLLGILVLLIVISNLLNRPAPAAEETKAEAKEVSVYQIGTSPRVQVQAQIEKSGVVTINALAPGVVQQVFVEAGTVVTQGQTILTTSSNYQGGNAASVQRSLAARQLQNVNETYDTQKDLIKKQKEIATKSDDNSDQLRDISNKSLDETRGLVSLNDSILSSIDANIAELEASNTGGTNDAAILGQKQLKAQFLGANNQLRSGLRNAEFSGAGDKPPAQLSDIQRDIAIKQLDIQEKAIDLNRDVTRLQVQLAQIQEAAMYPAAPFNATVQRVLVYPGQAVQPGTPLAVLSQTIEEDPIIAIAYVPRDIARKVSYFETSKLSIDNVTYEAFPTYVTQDAVQGSLYAVYFPIPDMYHQSLTNKGYISVSIPVGTVDTGSAFPYLPLDTIYQSQDHAYVFVAKDGKAVSKRVTLGPILGGYAQIEEGLTSGDAVITDRTVTDGEVITVATK
ncbi:MAG: hypothetical protein ACEQSA_04305 [Weeksellaceae bacterium]